MEAVQLAKVFGASKAISTASTTAKAEQAKAAGYEHVIDLSRESMKDGVMRITDGKGVDVVIDGISGKLTKDSVGSSHRADCSPLWAMPEAAKPKLS